MAPHRILSALVLLAAFAAPVQAEIYKYYDSNGNLVLTDTPPRDAARSAERIETKPVMTIPALGPQSGTDASSSRETPAAVQGYTVVIQAPADQSSFQRHAGEDIPVAYSVAPALADGHRLEVLLDGRSLDGGSISADSLDRGEHVLRVQVRDAAGKVLASAASSFHVQQHSALGPTAPKPKPAPKK